MTGVTERPWRTAIASARDVLLLGNASRVVAGYPADSGPRLRVLARAARNRTFVADRALDDGHAGSALTLYRDAALFHMAARVLVDGGDVVPEAIVADEVLARFQALLLDRPPPGRPDALEVVSSLVRAAPTARDTAETVAKAQAARATVRWLGTLVEPRGVAELKVERRLRVGVAGLVAVALLAWAIASLFNTKNVALHKPVAISGVHPGAPVPPAGLTDGVIVGVPFGVHTQVGDAPWVEVDLQALYRIDKVKVYNRGDGWFDNGLPMVLQFSENHVDFIDVATRTTTFSQTKPWIARTGTKVARYVRLRGPRNMYVALSEVEVYGSKK